MGLEIYINIAGAYVDPLGSFEHGRAGSQEFSDKCYGGAILVYGFHWKPGGEHAGRHTSRWDLLEQRFTFEGGLLLLGGHKGLFLLLLGGDGLLIELSFLSVDQGHQGNQCEESLLLLHAMQKDQE